MGGEISALSQEVTMMDFELLSSALTIVHGNDIYKPVI